MCAFKSLEQIQADNIKPYVDTLAHPNNSLSIINHKYKNEKQSLEQEGKNLELTLRLVLFSLFPGKKMLLNKSNVPTTGRY